MGFSIAEGGLSSRRILLRDGDGGGEVDMGCCAGNASPNILLFEDTSSLDGFPLSTAPIHSQKAY